MVYSPPANQIKKGSFMSNLFTLLEFQKKVENIFKACGNPAIQNILNLSNTMNFYKSVTPESLKLSEVAVQQLLDFYKTLEKCRMPALTDGVMRISSLTQAQQYWEDIAKDPGWRGMERDKIELKIPVESLRKLFSNELPVDSAERSTDIPAPKKVSLATIANLATILDLLMNHWHIIMSPDNIQKAIAIFDFCKERFWQLISRLFQK
jgi:hypothetical protein